MFGDDILVDTLVMSSRAKRRRVVEPKAKNLGNIMWVLPKMLKRNIL